MTGTWMRKRDTTVRFEGLDAMPPAAPLTPAFEALTDEEVERRAAADPDAGTIPPGFWDGADRMEPETEERITLRLDPDVPRWFRGLGDGHRARMNAVLRSCVDAQRKAA